MILAASARPRVPSKWLPQSLLDSCAQLQLNEVSAFFGSHPLLLISLPDALSPLYSTLVGSAGYKQAPTAEGRGADRDAIEFRTSFATPSRDPGSVPLRNQGAARETEQVSQLLSQTIYVHVLKKRDDDAAFLDKITVGRTRNHDLVLRDASVSKFHAAFQPQEDGSMTLRDMGSKNHTFVNGDKLSGSHLLEPGDSLMFGSVAALFCSPEGLWSALAGIRG